MSANKIEKLGTLIRHVRKEHGLTQEQLAATAGVGVRFIRELERGVKESVFGPDSTKISEEISRLKADDSNAPSRDTVPLPPPKLIDITASVKALHEAKSRVGMAASNVPTICQYTLHNTYDTLSCLNMSPNASLMSAGFTDSIIKLWNVKGTPVGAPPYYKPSDPSLPVKFVGHSGPVYKTSFTPDNKYMISASQDSTVRLWSLQTNKNLAVYKGHNYPVWDVQFGPFGIYFATTSKDRTARLWSCDHITPLRIFVGHESDVDVYFINLVYTIPF